MEVEGLGIELINLGQSCDGHTFLDDSDLVIPDDTAFVIWHKKLGKLAIHVTTSHSVFSPGSSRAPTNLHHNLTVP